MEKGSENTSQHREELPKHAHAATLTKSSAHNHIDISIDVRTTHGHGVEGLETRVRAFVARVAFNEVLRTFYLCLSGFVYKCEVFGVVCVCVVMWKRISHTQGSDGRKCLFVKRLGFWHCGTNFHDHKRTKSIVYFTW